MKYTPDLGKIQWGITVWVHVHGSISYRGFGLCIISLLPPGLMSTVTAYIKKMTSSLLIACMSTVTAHKEMTLLHD